MYKEIPKNGLINCSKCEANRRALESGEMRRGRLGPVTIKVNERECDQRMGPMVVLRLVIG
jgi:hypothetical protein